MMKNDIVIFETEDTAVTLNVPINNETVWLSQLQMKELFGVDRSVITRHINNIFKENELVKESNVQKMHIAKSDRPVMYYTLDVIISVGYRVKSKRGYRVSPIGVIHAFDNLFLYSTVKSPIWSIYIRGGVCYNNTYF